MRQPISWSALADASRSASGAWASRAGQHPPARALWASCPSWSTTRRRRPSSTGSTVLATDAGGLDALLACDVVVKSPGISRYRPEVARAGGGRRRRCAAASGCSWPRPTRPRRPASRGPRARAPPRRSAVHLLHGLGVRGRGRRQHRPPALGPLRRSRDPDYWVIETSSFQVPDLTVAPHVVAVTSLSPDHLDWHGTVERYYADKLSLCTKPGVELALADGSDERLRAQASLHGPARPVGARPTRSSATRAWSATLGLRGPAQRAQRLDRPGRARGPRDPGGRRRPERWRRRPPGFDGLPSRCRSLGRVGAVEFVDDSLSTNVLPAQAALDAFADRPVALLVGGHDRGVDYAPLGRAVAGRASRPSWSPCPTTGPASATPSAPTATARRGGRRGQPRGCGRRRLVGTRGPRARRARDRRGLCCRRRRPSFGRFGDYRERAGRLRRGAAARCGPLEAEAVQQAAPAGASSSRSLRNSHHESADTVAAACTMSGSAPNSARASTDQSACSTLLGAVHVPEARGLVVDAVVATQPVGLRRGDVRGLDLVGGHHGQSQRPGRSPPPCARAPAAPRSTAWPARRAPRRPPGQTTRRARRAARACRARRTGWPRPGRGPGPAGRADAMAARVTGSSRSMCRYCSA